jgi:hypothetical protein
MRQVVFFIHGVGKQQAGYSEGLEGHIRNTLAGFLDETDPNIIYKEILWAPILQRHQNELWQRVRKGDGKSDLDMVRLRKFMVGFAGDAIAYQNDEVGKPTYDAIHKTITDELESVQNELGDEEFELTIVAHSLGTVIASNYLYDHREKLTTVNFFTLGSPIAIWLLRYGSVTTADSESVVKVARPNGVWINILDDEDIIGYPLKPISAAYNKAVDMDYITEVGGPFSAGSPMSHVGYWEDGNVYKPIAKKLSMDYERIVNNTAYKWSTYKKYIKKLWNI